MKEQQTVEQEDTTQVYQLTDEEVEYLWAEEERKQKLMWQIIAEQYID